MKKRNIVVLMCDQLRPDFLPAYGADFIKTPNIDKLCTMGVTFDNAITQSPVCAPARASMMTGRYVSDHGVWTNDVPFRDGLEYLPQRMNSLGYKTAAFGKLHHFPAKDAKGFSFVKQMEEDRLKKDDDYFIWLRKKHAEIKSVFNYKGYEFSYPDNEYYDEWIADSAISYIENHQHKNSDEPFFAWVSFQGPHTPYDPPAGVKGSVNKDKIPTPLKMIEKDISQNIEYRRELSSGQLIEIDEIRIAYSEMIVEIDKQIGKLLDKLSSLGILENTSIIFSADHGDLLGDYSGLNAKGPYPYSQQLNVPLVFANHPGVSTGKRSDELVGNIDIPATVLNIANDTRGIGVSISLLDILKEKDGKQRKVNYSEFCDCFKLVENKDYRFCYYPLSNSKGLFDKKNDPYLLKNLSGKPEYAEIENRFLCDIIDFITVAHGVKIEAHDLVPEQQKELSIKNPNWLDDYKIAYPLNSKDEVKKIKDAGLNDKYNEFCIGKDILASYGCYWK